MEVHKGLVAGILAEPFDQAVEVTFVPAGKKHLDGDNLTQDAVEADFPLRLSQQIELETENSRTGLAALKPDQEQDVLAQRRGNCQRPVRLCVGRHGVSPLWRQ